MNLFDWLHTRFGTKTQPIVNPPAWLVAEGVGEQYNIPDRQLPEAQLELYQRLSWVQAAVYQVASTAATTKINVVRQAKEKHEHIEHHPFELLLQRPNPAMSRFELAFATFACYALTGNCYWWMNRSAETASPDEIWILPPHKVKPVPDGKMFLKGYVFEAEQDKPIPLELHEVVHFKRYHPLNPFVGLSPIESLAITATADMNMQRFGANYFDKGFAKPQGALAFADPIQKDQWDILKKDIKDNTGGTKREMLMLRGVGTGGVNWLPMALSHDDMQFLESRTFNKEEIFALFAPGLSSMLAVNATEANSLAGKKTFIELAVWPHLVAIQEKISNDVLPAYGQNLISEFEDIRITDRAMQLSEQTAFAAVHTIDEVREKFYEAEPLGDDRGNLLVAEIGKGMTSAEKPLSPQEQMEMQRQQAEANKPPAQDDKPQTEGQPESEEPDEEVRDEEAKRFKRWLKNRKNEGVDPTKFASDILSDAELVAIAAQIKQEVGADRPPFPGKSTRRLPGADGNDEKRAELERYHADKIHAALRRILRAVAPSGTTVDNITPDSAVERYKDSEKLLRDALIEMLMDGAQLGADTGIAQVEAILGVGKGDRNPIIIRSDSDHDESVKAVGITGVNWDLVNEAVLQWVLGGQGFGFGNGYGDVITQALAATSERQIRQNIAEWVNNQLPYNVLVDNLERAVFSRHRAETIAITEITRSYAVGNNIAWRESKVVRGRRWNTANDEIVRRCPICWPMHNQVVRLDEPFRHPNGTTYENSIGHPRDRCWESPVVDMEAL